MNASLNVPPVSSFYRDLLKETNPKEPPHYKPLERPLPLGEVPSYKIQLSNVLPDQTGSVVGSMQPGYRLSRAIKKA
jgi:hypothetical protein